MKQSTKRFISLVLSLVMMMAAFVVYVDLIKGAYDEVQGKKADILSRQELAASQRAIIERVRRQIETYKGEEAIVQNISLVLPPAPQMGEVLNQISGLARANFLSPQTFLASTPVIKTLVSHPSGQKEKSLVKPVGIITFQIKFIGSYDQLKKFLSQLETNIRLIDIQSLSIQPIKTSKDNLYSFELMVATYYQVNNN